MRIFDNMIEVNIIGTGNVAWHLAKAISSQNNAVIMQIAGRSQEALKDFAKFAQETISIADLHPAEVNIIAVSDDAIGSVAEMLLFTNALVVHTSGFTGMSALSRKQNKTNRHGVFYPLQTFSKEDVHLDFKEVPILIEAEDDKDEKTLYTLAETISNTVEAVDSVQRKNLHLAAVFANNFTNYCYTAAEEICEAHDISFKLLHPLILKTATKAIANGPIKSQTGPAKRDDTDVLAAQRKLLTKTTHREIYNTLTEALMTTYGKEL